MAGLHQKVGRSQTFHGNIPHFVSFLCNLEQNRRGGGRKGGKVGLEKWHALTVITIPRPRATERIHPTFLGDAELARETRRGHDAGRGEVDVVEGVHEHGICCCNEQSVSICPFPLPAPRFRFPPRKTPIIEIFFWKKKKNEKKNVQGKQIIRFLPAATSAIVSLLSGFPP